MSQLEWIEDDLKRVEKPVLRERLLMVRAALRGTLRSAADLFGCTHGKVDFWKLRYLREGLAGLKTRPKSGRPRKISRKVEVRIKERVSQHDEQQGWRTQRVRQLIFQETGVRYSYRQTLRIAQRWGLALIKPRPRYAYSKQEDRDAFGKKTVGSSPTSQLDGRSSPRTKASSFTT